MSLSCRHIPALDGVRAIAVLMVMAYHFPKSPAVERYFLVGQTGVDLFFVLSGFLITGILLDSREAPHALPKFYVRRVLRIFPLYYGVLFVLYIALPMIKLGPPTPLRQQLW